MNTRQAKALLAEIEEIEAMALMLQHKCRKAKQQLERFYAPAPKGEPKKRLNAEARQKLLGRRQLHIKKATAAGTAVA